MGLKVAVNMKGQKYPQRATHVRVTNIKIDDTVNLGARQVTDLGFRDDPSQKRTF